MTKKLGFLGLLMIFCLKATCQTDYSLPLNHLKLTSNYGTRIHPITKQTDFHRGIDLSARCEPVMAVLSGKVSSCGYDPILGNFVKIDHGEIRTVYGHLRMVAIFPGESVQAGTFIGITGSTGRSTGEHLHFAVSVYGSYVNPLAFLLGLTNLCTTE